MGARKLISAAGIAAVTVSAGWAQVPDLLNAFDVGGRAMGMGGGTYAVGADTMSTVENPAGLAFIGSSTTMGLVVRTLPGTSLDLSRSFSRPDSSLSADQGHFSVTHIGYAFPLDRERGSTGGAVGISFSTIGYLREERNGDGLITDSGTFIRTYNLLNRHRHDAITLAYGRSNNSGTVNYGIGVMYVLAAVNLSERYNELIDTDGDGLPDQLLNRQISSNSSVGRGVGVVVGAQFNPRPNVSFGISARSPIDLNGNASTSQIYDRIPMKISGSLAFRNDRLRNGRDYLVFGAQVDYFLDEKKGQVIQRDDQVVIGGGMEYNLLVGASRVPIRVGFQTSNARGASVPGRGISFRSRDTVTFGFGYHPLNGNYGFDANFGSGTVGGAFDMAFGLTYRFSN